MTHTLTDRQRVILDLLAEGQAPKQVARYMNLSDQTVKWHLARTRRVLGARNTTHAVAIYLRAKKGALSERGFRGEGPEVGSRCTGPRSENGSSPHGNPKTTSERPAAVPPLRPRAALVQWLAFKAVDGARRARIVL